ncbi:MAG: beta/gamma crystallin family protein [Betaproteobacteria bacterium]|nr:beta/gamma crystallin family protein [Betaproteobacteria bacterium]
MKRPSSPPRPTPSSRTAIRLAAAALMTAALPTLATEITIYQHDRFRGRSETLSGPINDLGAIRFANEISSFVVRGSAWELCTESNFRGTCRVFQPGEYSQVGDLNDRIRSVRDVKQRPAPVQSGQPLYPAPPAGNVYPSQVDSSRGITIYEHGSFSGRSISLNTPIASLESVGMNDMVSSLIVRGGVWELCVHANYQPPCKQFGPGDHWEVGEQFNDQFSSARPVNTGTSYPGSPSAGGAPPAGSDYGNPEAVVYAAENFRSGSRTLTGRMDNFDTIGFNDIVGSIIVHRGNWQFCTDANYRGNCQTLGPGRYNTLDNGLRNQISSARPERGSGNHGGNQGGNQGGNWGGGSGWSGGGWSGSRGSVTLYEYGEFIGRSYTITGTVNNLDPTGFNDKASSVVIERGTWEFCTDAHFRGTCRTVGPGRYGSIPPEMDSKISSVRQVGQ